jgi:signal peptidase II
MEAGLKQIAKNYGLLVLIAVVIIALDQWTKSIVRANLVLGEMWMPWEWLSPYARIVHWANTGVAFGMFQNMGTLFTILPFIVSGLIIYYYAQIPQPDWALRTALSLQLGGAIGNLIDRLTIGHVTDFVSVGNFPVFNVADASITVGVGILLLDMIIQERREKARQAAAEADAPADSAADPTSADGALSS